MRVGIDARELTGEPTGVGRVLEGLLEAWPDSGDELLLYARRPLPWRLVGPSCRVRIVPGPAALPGAAWEQTLLPRALARDRAEVLLAPAYGMPLASPCPAVVGMHDCAAEALPSGFGPRERLRRRLAARVAARRAAYLFTGSRFAAAEVRRWYGVPRRHVVQVPYGAGPGFDAVDEEHRAEVAARYRLGPSPVLFVGAPLARRRLSGLVEAVADLAADRPGLELVVAGPGGDRAWRAVPAGRGRGKRLRHLGYVPASDLPALYAAAAVVVYPSRYEGFGLPVLEAMACGAPVVASSAGSLGEIFRDRALLVAPDDGPGWRRALALLLDDEEVRHRRARAGARWARTRRWGPAARLVRRLLAAAGRRR